LKILVILKIFDFYDQATERSEDGLRCHLWHLFV